MADALMLYENYKIYGPYLRQDGRKHVIAYNSTKQERKTISYPKYLLEKKLNRYLEYNETVDHIDGNLTNDNLSNLQILSLADNIRKSTIIYKDTMKAKCIRCDLIIILDRKQQEYSRSNKKRGKKGPFCSKRCSGLYSHSL